MTKKKNNPQKKTDQKQNNETLPPNPPNPPKPHLHQLDSWDG